MRTAGERTPCAKMPELENLQRRLEDAEGAMRPRLEPVMERWRSAATEMESLLDEERTALEDAAGQLAAMQDRIEKRLADIEELADKLRGTDTVEQGAIASDVLRKLDVSTREIVTLSRLLRDRERVAETAEANARWLSDVNRLVLSSPWWWRFMPTRWQNRRRADRLRRAGLFDGHAYLKRYPDVTRAGVDPLRHYMLCGLAEGRLR